MRTELRLELFFTASVLALDNIVEKSMKSICRLDFNRNPTQHWAHQNAFFFVFVLTVWRVAVSIVSLPSNAKYTYVFPINKEH